MPRLCMSLFLIWSSIQVIKELIRVNTENVSPPGHFGIPQLTAPLLTYLPLSSQTRGLPLSPLHPFAFGSPAQSIDSSSIGWKWEFPFEHVEWFAVSSWACCKMTVIDPPETCTPKPAKWVFVFYFRFFSFIYVFIDITYSKVPSKFLYFCN